jgi:hypothetical protein
VKAGGKQRTDSSHVVAAVAELNQLELARESVRAAAGALTAAHPGWAASALHVSDWTRKYGTRSPAGASPPRRRNRTKFAVTCVKDGYALLRAVYDKAPPAWLAELPAMGRRSSLRATGSRPPGRHRIASPCDTDARRGALDSG